jgi:hypothetical protein
MTACVVSIVPAMLHEFMSPFLVTLAGSMTPCGRQAVGSKGECSGACGVVSHRCDQN